jgi:hypothetical protein
MGYAAVVNLRSASGKNVLEVVESGTEDVDTDSGTVDGHEKTGTSFGTHGPWADWLKKGIEW